MSSRLAARFAESQVAHRVGIPARTGHPIIVAGHCDYQMTGRREVIFVEHGAGQSYSPDVFHAAYSGGPDRDRVKIFICPNEVVAKRNSVAYPDASATVVGSPRLDRFHPAQPKPVSDPATIAFAWHADLRVCPEAASAFREFHSAIPMLVDQGYEVIGHGHPRILARLVPFYNKYGVRVVGDAEVLERADVLVLDNSSIGFEFASLGRPVVWMSPTFYRRSVTAWPRFWDALILGEHAESPDEVPGAVERALVPIAADTAEARERFISSVYSARDGQASIRAASAIEELTYG